VHKSLPFFAVIILILFVQAFLTDFVFIFDTKFFTAAGTLVILFPFTINSLSPFILSFRSFLIVIPEKFTAITAIDELVGFTLFTAASGTDPLFFPF